MYPLLFIIQLLFIYPLFISSCIAQKITENNNTLLNSTRSEELGFSKEVKKAEIREILYHLHDTSETLKEREIYFFNSTNDTVKHYHLRNKGGYMEEISVYAYKNDKRTSCVSHYMGYNLEGVKFQNLNYIANYFYNNLSQLVEIKTFKPVQKGERVYYHYSTDYYRYNVEGQKVKEGKEIHQIDPRDKTQIYDSNHDYETTFTYDKQGNLIMESEVRPKPYYYDSKTTTYSYNVQDQLIKKQTIFLRNGVEDAHIDSFYYDEKGRTKKKVSFNKKPGHDEQITKYCYKNNRIITEIIYRVKKGSIDLNKYKKYIYEYDTYGNKKEITEFYIMDNSNIDINKYKNTDFELGLNSRRIFEYEYWE